MVLRVSTPTHVWSRKVVLAIVVAALGYLVDIYDLIIFSVVRVPSLTELGVPAVCTLPDCPHGDLVTKGAELINWQMFGMLVGGILWGILGDKRGRLSVLFGSIVMYSLANLANAWVQDVSTYAALRFIAGIGLAGELGAGITLVSELTPPKQRGYATTMIAGVGICGALLAVLVGEHTTWRNTYTVGGCMGLALLVLRFGVLESSMFQAMKRTTALRGSLFALFRPRKRALRYISVVCVGLPIWYAIGILVTFCPEIGAELGLSPAPSTSRAVLMSYIGLAIGDFASGFLSQLLRSRKRAVAWSLALNACAIALYFSSGKLGLTAFYGAVLILGIANGYWAVFVTVAAEQFGTNLRATATTTAPNFVRGSVPLLTSSFLALSMYGRPTAALIVGIVTVGIAIVALFGLEETYGKDLDFVDE